MQFLLNLTMQLLTWVVYFVFGCLAWRLAVDLYLFLLHQGSIEELHALRKFKRDVEDERKYPRKP